MRRDSVAPSFFMPATNQIPFYPLTLQHRLDSIKTRGGKMGKRFKFTKQAVQDRLHPTIYKTSFEIKDEIVLEQGGTEEEAKNTLVMKVTLNLISLETDGTAEGRSRENVSPEQLAMRGGLPVREYRLSEEGLRIRSSKLSTKNSIGDGALEPALKSLKKDNKFGMLTDTSGQARKGVRDGKESVSEGIRNHPGRHVSESKMP